MALGCVLLSGATMRWASAYKPDLAISHLPDCTVMMGVPTYYTRLLDEPRFTRETCTKMRLFTSGSAPLLVETFNAFQDRTGHTILERYGVTETGMNCSNPLEGERKAGTVGPALPGIEIRFIDESGAPTPQGDVGDLLVRGDNVFKEYWRLPKKTAADFTKDGFFRTGDQVTVDTDGYVSIVGRSKDMVITGGLNVYPKEVEAIIDELPGVLESAVIGVPHRDFGEAVVAIIVPRADGGIDEDTVIAALKDRIANYKVPKAVRIVDALPRNAMSKVQKGRLREIFSDLF